MVVSIMTFFEENQEIKQSQDRINSDTSRQVE